MYQLFKKGLASFQIFLFLHVHTLYAEANYVEASRNSEFLEKVFHDDDTVIHGELPNGGWVDDRHNVVTGEGIIARDEYLLRDENGRIIEEDRENKVVQKSLYLLRMYKTQNLLRARKALLEMVHPDSVSMVLKHQNNVPSSVEDRYLKNPKLYREAGPQDDGILDMNLLIRQVKDGSDTSRSQRIKDRNATFKSLSGIAITMMYLDKMIRWLTDEIWKNNTSFNSILDSRIERAEGTDLWYNPFDNTKMTYAEHQIKLIEELNTTFGFGAYVERFLAARIRLFDMYPALGTEFEDKFETKIKIEGKKKHKLEAPLYEIIYNRLRIRALESKVLGNDEFPFELPDLSVPLPSHHINFRSEFIPATDYETQLSEEGFTENSPFSIYLSQPKYKADGSIEGYHNPIQDKLLKVLPFLIGERVTNSEGIEEDAFKTMNRHMTDFSWQTEKVFNELLPLFNFTIEQQLESNWNFLQTLNGSISIETNSMPFKLLALNESNWIVMKNVFQFWINPDYLDQAKEFILQRIEEDKQDREKRQQMINSFAMGFFKASMIALGIGFIAMLALFAVPLALLGSIIGGAFMFSAATGITSGVFFAIKAWRDVQFNNKMKKLTNDLYLSTNDSGDYDTKHDYRIMSKKSHREFIFAAVLGILFLRGPIARGLNFIGSKVWTFGKNLIGVPLKKVNAGLRSISELRKTLLGALPFMRQTLNAAEKGLRKARNGRTSYTDYLEASSRKSGRSQRSLKGIVTNSHIFKDLQKLFSNPQNFAVWKTEMFVEFMAAMVGEKLARGEDFWDEFGWVMFNTLFAMVVVTKILSHSHNMPVSMWTRAFGRGQGTILQRVGGFGVAHVRSTISLGTEVLKVATVFNAVAFLIRVGSYMVECSTNPHMDCENIDEEAKHLLSSAIQSTLIMTGLISVVSPAKGQLVYRHINGSIDKVYEKFGTIFPNSSLAFKNIDAIVPISIGNNTIGTFTMAYVLKSLNLQGGHGPAGGDHGSAILGHDASYIYAEKNKRNAQYLYPFILEDPTKVTYPEEIFSEL